MSTPLSTKDFEQSIQPNKMFFFPLEHKNVVAFMSNCDICAVYEALVTGTPVVTIPIGFDEPSNAALLHNRGVGVSLNLKTVTKEKVSAALNTIVNDMRYLRYYTTKVL
jgi:UDP:flavonoid glycosyltransferase YjiC (YdhE family)